MNTKLKIYIIFFLNCLAMIGMAVVLHDKHIVDLIFWIPKSMNKFLVYCMFTLPFIGIVMLFRSEYWQKLLGLFYLLGTYWFIQVLEKAWV